MKEELYRVNVDPFFLSREHRFNLKAFALCKEGKVHHLKYLILKPKVKKKAKPPEKKKPDLPLDDLMKVIAKYFRVSIEDIKGRVQGGNILKARQIYCYIARKDMGIRLRIIAASVNRITRNITHTCKSVDLIERNVNDRVTRKQHYQNVMDILESNG